MQLAAGRRFRRACMIRRNYAHVYARRLPIFTAGPVLFRPSVRPSGASLLCESYRIRNGSIDATRSTDRGGV